MIEVDLEEKRALVIAVDDGHRTTLSLQHEDGLELWRLIKEYYGTLEYGQGTDDKATEKGLFDRVMARLFPAKKGAPHG